MKDSDVEQFSFAREDRKIAALGCGVGFFALALAAIVFVGCPMAVSYGVSRGCAAGAEVAR